MATYSEKEKERILRIPIESVLAHFGARTAHRGEMYYSPFRDEREPSFHVSRRENLWKDFGNDEGGNVLTLASRLRGIALSEAWDLLASFDPGIVPQETAAAAAPRRDSSRIVIDSVSERFTLAHLVSYAGGRGIPRHILERYCRQVSFHTAGRTDVTWRAIGFPAGDGWVLRRTGTGSFSKRCTGSACSLLGASGLPTETPTCSRVEVFEGFFDFLSWLVLKDRTKPFSDVCVLNSVNNLGRGLGFISAHGSVSCWLDADGAGRRCLETLRETCPGAVDHMAELEEAGAKDVNELLGTCTARIVQENSIQDNTTNSFTIKK